MARQLCTEGERFAAAKDVWSMMMAEAALANQTYISST